MTAMTPDKVEAALGVLREAIERTDAYRDYLHSLSDDLSEALSVLTEALTEMERDAARWRALIGCGRIRALGSAGLTSDTDPNGNPLNGFAHLGVELWTINPYPEHPTEQLAVDWLNKFTDIAMKETP